MKSLRTILVIFIPLFVLGFIVNTLYKWNYIQHAQHLPDEFNIPNLRIGHDANKNRVDDAKDIVEGAKSYISNNPRYEAFTEYPNGFSPSNSGSNGDPIAYALTYAGYDIQNLIYQDIQKNQEAYPTNSAHSKEAAFRDIENLRVFLSRYGDQHDTDYYNINDWQSGDFVFFEKKHGAVVADRVNDQGVRFIIHHFWKYQAGYFQDVLETNAWGKVIGHYRINPRALSPTTDNPTEKQSTKTAVKE